MTPAEISIITPTYKRHFQLRRLLGSLRAQSVQIGQILVADGGCDAEHMVAEYADDLPVEWVACKIRGQIAQRNHALGRLRQECRYVIYLDDDIVLDADCIEVLVSFWNKQTQEPAGVGLNIINMPSQKNSVFRHVFFMQSRPYGLVLRSGYNTPVTGVETDIEAQWLAGGATIWRRDILARHANAPVATAWAVGEDLSFSYPIAKTEPLLVCAAARCRHEDNPPAQNFKSGRYRAYRGVIARFVFVKRHDELSRAMFIWMTLGQVLGRLARAITMRPGEWGALVGTVEALLRCLRYIGARDTDALLADQV